MVLGGGRRYVYEKSFFLIFPTIHKVVVMSLERVCAPGRVLWKGTDIESSCFFCF